MSVCIGCGLEIDSVTGLLKVHLKDGGGIGCTDVEGTGGGLFVTFPTPVTVPGRSPDECNGFEVRPNGYYSPCPKTVAGVIANDSVNNGILPFSSMTNGGTYTFGSGGPNVINNPLCCAVSGIISIRAGGLFLEAANNFYGSCHLEVNQGGGGLVAVNPDTRMVFENKTGSIVHTSFNNLMDENWLTIAGHTPSSIAAAMVVNVIAGGPGSILSGFVKFEYVLSLPMDCTCPA